MTDLYDLHMKKWCLSIATLNKRKVTIFPQTNVQPVMVSPSHGFHADEGPNARNY